MASLHERVLPYQATCTQLAAPRHANVSTPRPYLQEAFTRSPTFSPPHAALPPSTIAGERAGGRAGAVLHAGGRVRGSQVGAEQGARVVAQA